MAYDGSSVAPRAVDGRIDGRRLPALRRLVRRPRHVGDLIFRAKICRGIAVAVEAPLHRDGFVEANNLHLVDSTMTGGATDADCNVHGVVEVGVFGQLVNLDPLDGFTGLPALADRRQARALGLDD